MKWKITEVEEIGDTYITTVDYKVTINQQPVEVLGIRVSHFQVSTIEEIVLGIQNRGITEKKKIKAINNIKSLDNTIKSNLLGLEQNFNEQE